MGMAVKEVVTDELIENIADQYIALNNEYKKRFSFEEHLQEVLWLRSLNLESIIVVQ